MKSLKSFARRYYLKHILICVLVELMLFYAPLPVLLANPNPGATALPYGHDSPAGVSFAPAPSSLTIGNVANGTVINWKNFDIGTDATVTFNQANTSAYVLNRVDATDRMATGIMGDLIANGGIIVMNPRGIVIGPDALINAGKFVASGLGISDADFRNFANGSTNVLKFDVWCNAGAGDVTNKGAINAEAVYLVGRNVTNTSTGVISCPGGMIVMAAGEKVYLTHFGSKVSVEAPADLITPDGSYNKVTMAGTVNAAGAGVLLAAGDILSQAAITDARSFVAQANQHLNVNGALDVAGDIQLYADFDHVEGGDFHSTAPIAATGNIEVRGNDVLFDETVDAGGNLTIVGRDCHPPEWEWGNVTAMKTLHADGDIKISDTGEQKEWVDGHWEGRTWIEGHYEWHCGHKEWVCGYWEGGWYVPGYWEISYAPGTIYLHDDVIAGGNLMLCNNTETFNDTGFGVRLEAGRNVILAEDGIPNSIRDNCTYLHGRHNLEIVALNGRITNDSALFDNPDAVPSMLGADLTTISVEGSTLLMEQTPSFNLDNFTFANQSNTDLTLISHSGSVTAVETTKPENAADQWHSIGATAANKDGGNYAINLSGNQKDITATELRAYNDDIMVNAKVAKVLATENVKADTGSITLIGNTGIDVSKNLTAGDGITLDGIVTAVGTSTQEFEAGAGTLWAKNTITKTGAGDLHLGGDAGVNLDGTVDVKAGSLFIEDDFEAAGNLLASDNVTFNGSIVNGQLDGTVDQRIDAEGGTLWANGTLTKTSPGDLYLGGQTGIDLDGTVNVEAGSLIIEDDFTAADDLLAYDNVTLYGDGQFDDGVSAQRIDAQNGTLWAKGTLTKTSAGDIYLGGQTGIILEKTVDAEVGSLIIEDDFLAAGDLLASDNVTFNNSGQLNGLGDQKIAAASGAVYAGGTVTKTTVGQLSVLAGNGITLADNATALGSMYLDADTDDDGLGDVLAQDSLNATTGDLQVYGKNIQVAGMSNAGKDMKMIAADDITLGGAATAVGNMYLEADEDGDGVGDMWAQSTLTTTTGDIEISASDTTIKLDDSVSAGQDLLLNNNTVVAGGKELKAGQDVVTAASKTLTGSGELTVRAGRDIRLGGEVMTAGNMTISANPASSSSNVYADGKLTSDGDMLVEAGADVYLNTTPDSAYSGGDMIITASAFGDDSGDLMVSGNLEAVGDITLSSSDDTTYLGGDVYAGHNVLLNNNTKVNGYGDQRIEAGNKLTANGYVRKCTEGDLYLVGYSEDEAEVSIDLKSDTSTHQGNLWILGKEDIQISGDVTTFGEGCYEGDEDSEGATGGVAIISENGKIYTDGADGALNVSVMGSSDDALGTGVYGFGLYTDGGDGGEPTLLSETEGDEAVAAIAIVSAAPLKIGEKGQLTAYGQYYNDGSVDDRAGIGFLDVDAEIPAGVPRNPGVPFDLAIYTASKTSGVEVSGPVTITSGTAPGPMPTIAAEIEPRQTDFAGAMVIDAYDIVSFGDESSPFRVSLAAGEVGDRLEVCSRITEWLEDAVGRLPFAGDDFELPGGDTFHYVMRGAGLENDQITDGRAWVLEAKTVEHFIAAAPIQQPELKFTGCPAVMNWVAKELGLEAEQLQIYMDSTLAMSSGIQPCDVCARLKNTALVLMDADETQLKALGQVVNEFAAAGAPPSEEQMAMIATALQNPQEGTQYALAAQWLDALAEYINILNKDLKLPADESMALAAKYTAPVTGGDNAALAAYVQVRLAAIGG